MPKRLLGRAMTPDAENRAAAQWAREPGSDAALSHEALARIIAEAIMVEMARERRIRRRAE